MAPILKEQYYGGTEVSFWCKTMSLPIFLMLSEYQITVARNCSEIHSLTARIQKTDYRIAKPPVINNC